MSEKPLAMVEKYAYGLEANGRKKKLTGGEARFVVEETDGCGLSVP